MTALLIGVGATSWLIAEVMMTVLVPLLMTDPAQPDAAGQVGARLARLAVASVLAVTLAHSGRSAPNDTGVEESSLPPASGAARRCALAYAWDWSCYFGNAFAAPSRIAQRVVPNAYMAVSRSPRVPEPRALR
jgi:hypothetical protein